MNINDITGMLRLHFIVGGYFGIQSLSLTDFKNKDPKLLYKRMLKELTDIGKQKNNVLIAKNSITTEEYDSISQIVAKNPSLNFISFIL